MLLPSSASVNFNFNFKLEAEIALFSISPALRKFFSMVLTCVRISSEANVGTKFLQDLVHDR